jgi:hypothetical protein
MKAFAIALLASIADKATGTASFDSVPTKWKDGAVLLNGQFHIKTPDKSTTR